MATVNDFGIRGINSGGILQPKLKNRWRITFANMGSGGQSDGSVGLSMQATSVTRPTISFEEVELHRYNSRAFIASKHSVEPMNLTLEDDVTGTASRVVQDQIQAQQHLIGAGGPFLADSLSTAPEGSLYKFVTYLDMLDGATDNVIEKWTIEGCFIQNVNYGDLDYSASDQVTIELTIRYDHARQDALNGYNSGEGVATGGMGSVQT